MNQLDFSRVTEHMLTEATRLLVVKGGEYAGSGDRLANFKRGAQLTGATPLQVAFIYAGKHWDAIASYVADQASGKVRARSEPIEGRLQDLLNYCVLMNALIKDQQDVTGALRAEVGNDENESD